MNAELRVLYLYATNPYYVLYYMQSPDLIVIRNLEPAVVVEYAGRPLGEATNMTPSLTAI